MYPASVLATRPNAVNPMKTYLKGTITQNSGLSVFSLLIRRLNS